MEYKEEKGRIAAYDDQGQEVGEATWSQAEDSMILDHTFVNPSLRGQGVAAELVKRAVDVAKRENYTVIPLCPYAKREFDRTPEYQKIRAGK